MCSLGGRKDNKNFFKRKNVPEIKASNAEWSRILKKSIDKISCTEHASVIKILRKMGGYKVVDQLYVFTKPDYPIHMELCKIVERDGKYEVEIVDK